MLRSIVHAGLPVVRAALRLAYVHDGGGTGMKIALAQRNYTVGDLCGNAAKIAGAVREARAGGADLVVTSELALTGYPPRDLLLRRSFVEASLQALEDLAQDLRSDPPVLVGIAEPNPLAVGRPLFNTAALLASGRIQARFRKCLLPTYDVFDEDRYFEPAAGPQILHLDGCTVGITICEDIWNDCGFWARRRYHADPVEELARGGVDCVINLSASPFTVGKQKVREAMLSAMAHRCRVPVFYVNQVGGNDDLVFDGCSFAMDAAGRLGARARAFAEDLLVVDLMAEHGSISADDSRPEAEIWQVLVLGTRDYVRKCGFSRVYWGSRAASIPHSRQQSPSRPWGRRTYSACYYPRHIRARTAWRTRNSWPST